MCWAGAGGCVSAWRPGRGVVAGDFVFLGLCLRLVVGSEVVLVPLAVSAFGLLGAATCMAGALCGILGMGLGISGWLLGSRMNQLACGGGGVGGS